MPLRPWSVGVCERGDWWYDQLSARLHSAPAVVLRFGWPEGDTAEVDRLPLVQVLVVVPQRSGDERAVLELVAAWRRRHRDGHVIALLPMALMHLAPALRTLFVQRIFPAHVPPARLADHVHRVCHDLVPVPVRGREADETVAAADPLERHDAGLPVLLEDRCRASGRCVAICPCDCLQLSGAYPVLARPDRCVRCGLCVAVCPTAALIQPLRPELSVGPPSG